MLLRAAKSLNFDIGCNEGHCSLIRQIKYCAQLRLEHRRQQQGIIQCIHGITRKCFLQRLLQPIGGGVIRKDFGDR